jgi:hypothetical protein
MGNGSSKKRKLSRIPKSNAVSPPSAAQTGACQPTEERVAATHHVDGQPSRVQRIVDETGIYLVPIILSSTFVASAIVIALTPRWAVGMGIFVGGVIGSTILGVAQGWVKEFFRLPSNRILTFLLLCTFASWAFVEFSHTSVPSLPHRHPRDGLKEVFLAGTVGLMVKFVERLLDALMRWRLRMRLGRLLGCTDQEDIVFVLPKLSRDRHVPSADIVPPPENNGDWVWRTRKEPDSNIDTLCAFSDVSAASRLIQLLVNHGMRVGTLFLDESLVETIEQHGKRSLTARWDLLPQNCKTVVVIGLFSNLMVEWLNREMAGDTGHSPPTALAASQLFLTGKETGNHADDRLRRFLIVEGEGLTADRIYDDPSVTRGLIARLRTRDRTLLVLGGIQGAGTEKMARWLCDQGAWEKLFKTCLSTGLQIRQHPFAMVVTFPASGTPNDAGHLTVRPGFVLQPAAA